MPFDYTWKNNEANFGPPEEKQLAGGLHITFEIILQKDNFFVAVRRPEAIPGHEQPPKNNQGKGFLYFCHSLIRYAESVEACVKRIVKEQTGVNVKDFRVLDIESNYQDKDKQWAFMPYVLAELEKFPQAGIYGNAVTEVIQFNKDSIPDDFGWWDKQELKDFFNEFNL